MEMLRDAKALEAIANEQGLGVEELETYAYMNDVESMVNAALGELAGEFDTEAIINRAFGWYVPKSCYVNIVNPDAFWQIVEDCELTHVARSRTR
jgi:hypothetical protein